MGSMAEAATTPEKETETVAVEGMVALPASAPASVPTVNPTSPVEVKNDQVDKEADLPVQEPPEKRSRTSLEDELRKLMERTREGYDLTASALEKVQQHLDISRQFGQDLTQLAQDVHCNKVGAKYQLAQLQQVLSSFQNLEWQVGGSKQESNTSIKSLVNKLLAASTTSKEALKSIHGELREGNDKMIQAINDGFEKMTTALQGISLPGKETAGFPPGFPPAPTVAPPSVAPPSVAPPPVTPVAPTATSIYGMPGYASSYAAGPPNTPQTPPVVPKAPMASSISMLQLGVQRDRISNHHSLWFWWWQMNQDSPAGLQYRRRGTSLEANFQGITWMNSGWAAFTTLVDFTEGCQMDFFQSEFGVKESEAAQFPGMESQLSLSWVEQPEGSIYDFVWQKLHRECA